MENTNKSVLDILYDKLGASLDNTSEHRALIINQLMVDIKNLPSVIAGNENNADLIQAKLALIKTVDDVLKSEESNKINLVKIHLQRKESESNINAKEAAVAMLKSITLTKEKVKEPIEDNDAIRSEINNLITKSGEQILDGELLTHNEEEHE